MIVPFPPGGGADLTARLLAQTMGEGLGQPVVVENKPGANGILGSEATAHSAPDGYTIMMVDRGALGINPSIYKSLPYDPVTSFAHIGIATDGPYVLVADPKLGAKNLADLVAVAKAKTLAYGSFGVGSMAQINIESLAQRVGVKLQHVPYKGAGPAVSAVVRGEVAMAIASPPSVLGFIAEGKLVAVAVGSDKRLPLLPDVPTLAEAGLSDVLLPTYFALVAPAGTTPEIVQKLNGEMRRAVMVPRVAERLVKSGLVPVGGSPEQMAEMVKQDVANFGQIVRAIGIKQE
jgi:tripartite-type tricarboxylate transporter receptor subunit TctC